MILCASACSVRRTSSGCACCFRRVTSSADGSRWLSSCVRTCSALNNNCLESINKPAIPSVRCAFFSTPNSPRSECSGDPKLQIRDLNLLESPVQIIHNFSRPLPLRIVKKHKSAARPSGLCIFPDRRSQLPTFELSLYRHFWYFAPLGGPRRNGVTVC